MSEFLSYFGNIIDVGNDFDAGFAKKWNTRETKDTNYRTFFVMTITFFH